jgi:hypothetical protein
MFKKPVLSNVRPKRNSCWSSLLVILVLTISLSSAKSAETEQYAGLAVLNLLEAEIEASPKVIDSDGDGLSDFWEIHKYFTDPAKKDTDDDGVSDGDWNERREYTYSVRSILRFMPPFDRAALNDDFQDARVLEKRNDYIELEVIHYPLATPHESIEENPNWQQDYADMTEYLRPGVTTNWNAKMKRDLLAELKADGIVVDKLTDKQVVRQVSSWLMKKSKSLNDIFTTYYVHFPNGQPSIYPGLEDAFRRHKGNYGWTNQQQFEHELFGRDMFYHKTHGSCTSTAVYLTTVLRTVGIPTRMIIAIPAVDPSNEDQVRLVRERITHNQVRDTMLACLGRSGQSFAAHTYNEVYVGDRWHRLNYNKLGQSILDKNCLGLQTHLYTFNDLSEANLAPTWGFRYGKGIKTAVFKHSNPYSVVTLSDLFGSHSNIPNLEVPTKVHQQLTISKAYWFHSNARPHSIPGNAVPDDNNGHILFHIDEWFEGEGIEQYESFYSKVDKCFLLKSQGNPDVRAFAERGYWNQEFYIRIPEKEYLKMAVKVPYTIHAINSNPEYRWKVKQTVTIRKLREPDYRRLPASLPNIYVMSPSDFVGWWREFVDIVKDVTANKTGRSHEVKSYDEIFIDGIYNKKSGDIIVLLFSLDTDGHIPVEYADLLPVTWPAIELALKQGKTLELKSEAREMNIIVLAAPNRNRLSRLINESSFLKALKAVR